MADDITESQKAFVAAIEDKVNQFLSSRLDGTFNMVNYPSGFNWTLQLPPNNYYNSKTLDDIDFTVSLGDNGIHTLSASSFATMYGEILSGASYVYNKADSATIAKYQGDATAQESSVITAWEQEVGPITADQIKSAFPPNKFGYITGQVATRWTGDASKIPSSLNNFRVAWQAYQTAAAASYSLLTRAAKAGLQLSAAQANVTGPSADNGGMQVSDKGYFVGYGGLPATTQINSGLQTLSNSVSVDISVSNFSSTQSNLSISGKVGFTIPIADIVSFGISGGASYNLSKYKQSTSSLDMNIEYHGVTVIGSHPVSLSADLAQGWYVDDIISEVAENLNKGDVTGFKLGSNSEFTKFGEGSKFSRLKTFVISQQPTITMIFKGGDVSKVASDFKENASLSVKLFGLFDIGSVSQSYDIKKVDDHSQAGEVVITLGPPEVIGTTPAADSTAYIMGGVISAPPDN